MSIAPESGMRPRHVWGLVCIAMLCSLLLGASSLGEPSLWHDESVHVFVAKNIADHGESRHPSGVPYYNGSTFNVILAGFIKAWGWSEAVVRTPAVIAGVLNVLLTFLVVRPLLGTPVALVTAFGVAWCPWTVAWSREARFYTMQQTLYLVVLLSFWKATEAGAPKKACAFAGVALAAYVLGLLTSFHSVLFLSGVGLYAGAMLVQSRQVKSRWMIACMLLGAAGLLTIAVYSVTMNAMDRDTVLNRSGLGGGLIDVRRADRFYYFTWLGWNLGRGVMMFAMIGFGLMLYRERGRGLYAALAFWGPLLLLTFVIGYRRPRFMLFAFPMYIAAASYASVHIVKFVANPGVGLARRLASVALALLMVRIMMTALFLAGDSVVVASGTDLTLARYHPGWRQPCTYVRDNLKPDEAVLTTTYLPTLYYVGRVDNWYPSRILWAEEDESGIADLKGLDELKAWIAKHPKGYFISDWWRFERNTNMREEQKWVRENMTALHQHSSERVTLWAWGIGEQ